MLWGASFVLLLASTLEMCTFPDKRDCPDPNGPEKPSERSRAERGGEGQGCIESLVVPSQPTDSQSTPVSESDCLVHYVCGNPIPPRRQCRVVYSCNEGLTCSSSHRCIRAKSADAMEGCFTTEQCKDGLSCYPAEQVPGCGASWCCRPDD